MSQGGSSTVVTSDSAEAGEPTELALKWGEKPVVVYVCDEAAGCEGFDKLEEVVLKDEKVALGMKGSFNEAGEALFDPPSPGNNQLQRPALLPHNTGTSSG